MNAQGLLNGPHFLESHTPLIKIILTFVYIFIYFMSKIIQIIICKDQSVFQIDNIINPTLSVLGNSIRKM